MTKRYPTWRMPDLYYSKLFDIGNGKKFGTLFVDSCLGLCANYSYAHGTGGMLLTSDDGRPLLGRPLSPEAQRLKFGVLNCSDPFMMQKGNEMMNWINDTLESWSRDESIIWKATV